MVAYARAALYEPAQFEPLTDEPWDPARVADAIAIIVADADAAFDPDALWPAHEWDGWEEPVPLKNLYVGAAGVIRALDALRRRGQAETSLERARHFAVHALGQAARRTAAAVTRSGRATWAPRCSLRLASTSTRAIRSSTSSEPVHLTGVYNRRASTSQGGRER